MTFEILEEGNRHAIIESDGQEYLIEDRGYDEEEGVFRFEVLNDEVVSTPENIKSDEGEYPIPDVLEISLSAAKEIDSYLEAVETVAENSAMIDGVHGDQELFSGDPHENNGDTSRTSLRGLDISGSE